MALSKLKKVDLREEWKHEASDFTNWLAQKDNLELLSEEIGIDDISLIQTEASVGQFSVDILAEEGNTGRKVVIENQLESTNHMVKIGRRLLIKYPNDLIKRNTVFCSI